MNNSADPVSTDLNGVKKSNHKHKYKGEPKNYPNPLRWYLANYAVDSYFISIVAIQYTFRLAQIPKYVYLPYDTNYYLIKPRRRFNWFIKLTKYKKANSRPTQHLLKKYKKYKKSALKKKKTFAQYRAFKYKKKRKSKHKRKTYKTFAHFKSIIFFCCKRVLVNKRAGRLWKKWRINFIKYKTYKGKKKIRLNKRYVKWRRRLPRHKKYRGPLKFRIRLFPNFSKVKTNPTANQNDTVSTFFFFSLFNKQYKKDFWWKKQITNQNWRKKFCRFKTQVKFNYYTFNKYNNNWISQQIINKLLIKGQKEKLEVILQNVILFRLKKKKTPKAFNTSFFLLIKITRPKIALFNQHRTTTKLSAKQRERMDRKKTNTKLIPNTLKQIKQYKTIVYWFSQQIKKIEQKKKQSSQPDKSIIEPIDEIDKKNEKNEKKKLKGKKLLVQTIKQKEIKRKLQRLQPKEKKRDQVIKLPTRFKNVFVWIFTTYKEHSFLFQKSDFFHIILKQQAGLVTQHWI